MVRRATAALLGTLAGTALLVGAKYAAPPTAGAGNAVGDTGDPGTDPGTSGSVDPSASGSGAPASPGASGATGVVPTAGPTSTKATPPAGGSTPTGTKTTTTASCKNYTGDPVNLTGKGIGAMTVTIKVCGGKVTSSSGVLSQSNWDANAAAIAQMNTQAVQYYKTDLSKIAYSGATRTAEAYRASLSSAVKKAGL